MDTRIKLMPEMLNFTDFIKEYYNWYEFDQFNSKIIEQLGLWANRSSEFNNLEPGWHIDRGILIYGNFGAGKDELFRLLYNYLRYLKSRYVFKKKVVWQFAGDFSSDGYECFNTEGSENKYYEELALTDENTGQPTREMVSHYGNKILVGAELIHIRYNIFKGQGLQSHFSTNVGEDELKNIYGGRIYSRLKEMCNFIRFIGKDRRLSMEPKFLNNTNQKPAADTPITYYETIETNKMVLEGEYKKFLAADKVDDMAVLHYTVLKSLGCDLGSEDEIEVIKNEVARQFYEQSPLLIKTPTEKEREKRNFINTEAKKILVRRFYQKLKELGADSIFNQVDVNVEKIANDIVKENKQNQ